MGDRYWTWKKPAADTAPGGDTTGAHAAGREVVTESSRLGSIRPRLMADWSYGLACVVGPLGVVVGIAVGASSTPAEGYPEHPAVNNWPVGVGLMVAAVATTFWLVAAGVIFQWLAALFEAVAPDPDDEK